MAEDDDHQAQTVADMRVDATSPPAAEARAAVTPWTRRSLLTLLAGGAVTGLLAGGTLSMMAGPTVFEIDQLPQDEVAAASQSIPPVEATPIVDDAKACRTPLAYLTLRAHPGSAGNVRIRSGSFSTPSLRVTAAPIRVAVPFPAPYPVGRGDLMVDGSGLDLDIFLRPGWTGYALQGTAIVHVWWRPKDAC